VWSGRELLRYDINAGWKPLPPLRMSQFVDRVQGADLAQGAVWLSTDDARKGLYRVDLASGATNYLDVGAGQSQLTWQVNAGLGYQFDWGSVIATWRYLDYNFKSGSRIESMNFNGPTVGVAFRW
jgi:hypothetical protein